MITVIVVTTSSILRMNAEQVRLLVKEMLVARPTALACVRPVPESVCLINFQF